MFPDRAYFQIADMGKFGCVIRELSVCDAGDIEKAAQAIDDDTAAFYLIESGKVTDVSEDIAAKWMELYAREAEADARHTGRLFIHAFIVKHVPDLVDDLEGRIATAAMNDRHFPEHHYAMQVGPR